MISKPQMTTALAVLCCLLHTGQAISLNDSDDCYDEYDNYCCGGGGNNVDIKLDFEVNYGDASAAAGADAGDGTNTGTDTDDSGNAPDSGNDGDSGNGDSGNGDSGSGDNGSGDNGSGDDEFRIVAADITDDTVGMGEVTTSCQVVDQGD